MTKDIQPTFSEPEKPDASVQVPEKIGKYTIEGLLERGGMSLLYLGIHPETEEPIIIKVLSPKYVSNPEAILGFLNEARILSLADHPNIIKHYDYGQWENGLYIAMEFIRGTSLRKILVHQPFSLRRALEVILQIAYALCHLHTHGVIHGDLKPENILITNQGQVKVIDFGIAKILSENQDENKEACSRVIGTPIYMSPEARENPQAISFQSDIYSLGIIAYELVLGKITHGKVLLSLAPRGMQKILTKALQPTLEDRYQDIVDFITDISTYMNSQEVEKDKQGSDYFFELFERMEKFQTALLPIKPPSWPNVDMGLVQIFGMGKGGLFYDFFDFGPTKKAIFAATNTSKGAEGVLFSSMVRSILRTLTKNTALSSQNFFEAIERQIDTDISFGKTNMALFLFDFETHTFEYFAKDFGFFDHCSEFIETEPLNDVVEIIATSENAVYQKTIGKFSTGHRFLFLGFTPQKTVESTTKAEESQEKIIKSAFRPTNVQPSQKLAESMLTKMRLGRELYSYEHPLLMIVLNCTF